MEESHDRLLPTGTRQCLPNYWADWTEPHPFDEVAPDLERYLMEFVFEDINSRPALDVRQCQLAAIVALGTCQLPIAFASLAF